MANDPVCGMAVSEDTEQRVQHEGHEYLFCSAHCRQKFVDEPSRYIRTEPASTGLTDPVCGMSVTEDSPHHVEHAGHTHYFCSTSCQEKFVADPGQYLGD